MRILPFIIIVFLSCKKEDTAQINILRRVIQENHLKSDKTLREISRGITRPGGEKYVEVYQYGKNILGLRSKLRSQNDTTLTMPTKETVLNYANSLINYAQSNQYLKEVVIPDKLIEDTQKADSELTIAIALCNISFYENELMQRASVLIGVDDFICFNSLIKQRDSLAIQNQSYYFSFFGDEDSKHLKFKLENFQIFSNQKELNNELEIREYNGAIICRLIPKIKGRYQFKGQVSAYLPYKNEKLFNYKVEHDFEVK